MSSENMSLALFSPLSAALTDTRLAGAPVKSIPEV